MGKPLAIKCEGQSSNLQKPKSGDGTPQSKLTSKTRHIGDLWVWWRVLASISKVEVPMKEIPDINLWPPHTCTTTAYKHAYVHMWTTNICEINAKKKYYKLWPIISSWLLTTAQGDKKRQQAGSIQIDLSCHLMASRHPRVKMPLSLFVPPLIRVPFIWASGDLIHSHITYILVKEGVSVVHVPRWVYQEDENMKNITHSLGKHKLSRQDSLRIREYEFELELSDLPITRKESRCSDPEEGINTGQ